MKHRSIFLAPALLLATLAGCAVDGPLARGTQVRAIMASQIVAPQAGRNAAGDTGSDGAAAVAAQANYQQSFVTPTPQSDSPTFGNSSGK